MFDPDDVIVGLVGTLTSRDTYNSVPRDLHSERIRRTKSETSTRRNDRSWPSLVRVDSGLADESVAVSRLSGAFTDDIHDELIVPPAPALVLDSLNTVQHFAMSRQTTGSESTISYVADTGASRVAKREDKENRMKGSANSPRRTRRKRRVKKTKEVSLSKPTEKLTRGNEEKGGTGGKGWTGGSRCVDESLWDMNGVKLSRVCEEILNSSSKVDVVDIVKPTVATATTDEFREPGRSVT